MGNHLVLHQLAGAAIEVAPHQVLGEREEPDDGLLAHLPALERQDGFTQAPEQARDVHAGLVALELLQALDRHVELGRELLQQRHVHLRLVVGELAKWKACRQ